MKPSKHARELLEAIENEMIISDDEGMKWYFGGRRIRLVSAEIEGEVEIEENGYVCENFDAGVKLLREYGYITEES